MKRKKSHPSHKKIILAGEVAKVEDKLRVKLNAPQLLQHFLNTHSKEGDVVSMQLLVKRPKRSEAQNNFFFLYLDLISLSCGHSVEELHDWVNQKVIGQGITEVFGTKIRKVGHTSYLNISEFAEMMNRVYEETDIPIPDPAPFKLPLSFDEYGKLKVAQTEAYRKMKNRLL